MCHRIYRWSGNLGGCWLHLRWWYDLGCVVSFFAVEEVLKRWSTPGNKRYLYKSPLWSSQIILMHAKNQAFAAQRADLKSKLQSLEDFKADLTRNFMLWAPFQNGIYLQPIWVRFNYVQGGVSMGPQLKNILTHSLLNLWNTISATICPSFTSQNQCQVLLKNLKKPGWPGLPIGFQ